MLYTLASPSRSLLRFVLALNILTSISSVYAFTSYANDFVDPDYILAGNYGDSSRPARLTIASWARELAAKGPWTVINKTATPPTGDKRTYMSWAP
ncbi:hypothetical protein ONZ45_g18163 [Pleurotus djamor]|nr:hypothetical protein ONZ45_g18163 [Pleurotus djamor]